MFTAFKNLVAGFLLALRDLLDPFFHFQEAAILCYHSISDTNVSTAISPDIFSAQLAYLKKSGATFVSLSDIVAFLTEDRKLPPKSVAITFDDGYADFETTALPILEKFGAAATIFLVGDEAASRTELANSIPLLAPEAIARLGSHPLVEIGYHSKTHPDLLTLSDEALHAECRAPFPARFFAYPGGHYDQRSIEALRGLGYQGACSIKRRLLQSDDDPLLLPRSVVTRNFSPRQVRFHTTKALDWYRALS